MASNDNDDDDAVGYGKPPKRARFKKGQSGNADGGWGPDGKRTKDRAAAQAAKAEAAKQTIPEKLVAIFKKMRRVSLRDGDVEVTSAELILMTAVERAIQGDNHARKMVFQVMRDLGLLAAPPTERPGVLVVYPIMEQQAWIDATEGELLPKDPLHGTPYAGGKHPKPGRGQSAP